MTNYDTVSRRGEEGGGENEFIRWHWYKKENVHALRLTPEELKNLRAAFGLAKGAYFLMTKVRILKGIRPRPLASWTGSAVLRSAGYPAGFDALL